MCGGCKLGIGGTSLNFGGRLEEVWFWFWF